MRFKLLLLLFSMISPVAFATNEIVSENTLFKNGMNAASYADLFAQNSFSAGSNQFGGALGFQLIRASIVSISAGFTGASLGKADGSLNGGEFHLALIPDSILYGGLSYIPTQGKIKREDPADGEEKYMRLRGADLRLKIAFRATDTAHVLFTSGFANLETSSEFSQEWKDRKSKPDGLYCGLGVRFTHL